MAVEGACEVKGFLFQKFSDFQVYLPGFFSCPCLKHLLGACVVGALSAVLMRFKRG